VRSYFQIDGNLTALGKVIRKLEAKGSELLIIEIWLEVSRPIF
jgi:hypothetical protein